MSPSNNESGFMSAVEQGLNDRVLFDMWRQNERRNYEPIAVEAESTPYFSEIDATDFIKELAPNLEPHYGWVSDVNPTDVARLLNEVQLIREDYMNKKGEYPTDAYIYRHYRMETTSAEAQQDDFNHTATLLLDAIMNGDVTNSEQSIL